MQRSNFVIIFFENYVEGGASKFTNHILHIIPKKNAYYLVSNVENKFLMSHIVGDNNKKHNTLFLNFISRAKLYKLFPDKHFFQKAVKPIVFLSPFFVLANLFRFLLRMKNIKKSNSLIISGGYPLSEAGLAFFLMMIFFNCKCKILILSYPAPRKKCLFIYEYLLDKIVSKFTRLFCVNSRTQSHALQQHRGIYSNKIKIIYNQICFEKLQKTKFQKKTTVSFGCIGRLDNLKGQDILIEACKSLDFDYECNIIGEGPRQDELYKTVINNCLENKIIFHGYVAEKKVKEIIKKFQFLVVPSLWEGLPYVVLEGLFHQLPIIASKVGAIPEIIKHMRNGILVPPGDSIALSFWIRKISNNTELQKRLILNNYKINRAKFSPTQFKRKVHQYILNEIKK